VDADGRHHLYQWLLPRLTEAWDSGSAGSIGADDHRYVQWAGYDLGLQIECQGNCHLTGDARLTPEEIQRLRRLGWHDPVADDLPNHWQVFFDRDDLPKAAMALVDAVALLRDGAAAGDAEPR